VGVANIAYVTDGSNGVVTTDGSFVTYTPNPGFIGIDTFTYHVYYTEGGGAEGLVTVDVMPTFLPTLTSQLTAEEYNFMLN